MPCSRFTRTNQKPDVSQQSYLSTQSKPIRFTDLRELVLGSKLRRIPTVILSDTDVDLLFYVGGLFKNQKVVLISNQPLAEY